MAEINTQETVVEQSTQPIISDAVVESTNLPQETQNVVQSEEKVVNEVVETQASSQEEVHNDTTNTESSDNVTKEEQNQPTTHDVDSGLTDDVLLQELTKKGISVQSLDELQSKLSIDDNLLKLNNLIKDTGLDLNTGMQVFNELNQDYNAYDKVDLSLMYYKDNESLDEDELVVLAERLYVINIPTYEQWIESNNIDEFSDEDDNLEDYKSLVKNIKSHNINAKMELNKIHEQALGYYNSRKEKYKSDIQNIVKIDKATHFNNIDDAVKGIEGIDIGNEKYVFTNDDKLRISETAKGIDAIVGNMLNPNNSFKDYKSSVEKIARLDDTYFGNIIKAIYNKGIIQGELNNIQQKQNITLNGVSRTPAPTSNNSGFSIEKLMNSRPKIGF